MCVNTSSPPHYNVTVLSGKGNWCNVTALAGREGFWTRVFPGGNLEIMDRDFVLVDLEIGQGFCIRGLK